jgi:maleylacetate reductase
VTQRYENWHQPWCVIHGSGALASLPVELDRLEIDRALLLTTPALSRQQQILSEVRALLGRRLVAQFHECERHVPRAAVLAAARTTDGTPVTGIVALGGGSVIDTGKGVALAMAAELKAADGFDSYRVDAFTGPVGSRLPFPDGLLPIVALPTTLSGAEYTNVAGIVDPNRHVKDLYRNDALAPRTIILDPALAAATPPELWCSTGVKTMSDGIEQLYSRFSHPVVEAVTMAGITRLVNKLTSYRDGQGDAVMDCYLGSWLSVFAGFSANTLTGIGASLRHQIGAAYGAPHAEIGCVLLPHIMRFNLPATPHLIEPLSVVFGLDATPARGSSEVDPLCDAVQEFVGSLGLPTTLEEIGVDSSRFSGVARHSFEDFTGGGNPRPASEQDLLELLQAAS